ncbi:SAM-dependent methyltransferase [Burkholderia plantarii]|uniref:SAM-dependent methyltransferase n=1 Tax=Burkholderia plantarii TaxID=41899 RepID=UPI0018DD3F7C|nr:class I SAM-dependent methyltransferase [Burkholderia plantarii]MBI0325590.1 class I SAM-dependent methyltransferase [Burkholderia plantarii]
MTDAQPDKRTGAGTGTGHYEPASLVERLRAALAASGLDAQPLRPEDLAALDQFHSRGLAATRELARQLPLGPTTRVLDIGAGLGGPSRYLAARYGCEVQGIDLSRSFVEAASFLAQRCGLAGRVGYRHGNALALPYEAGSFDVAWTQHVAMNIADRDTLYAEAFRVLRPGGRFAIFDVVAAGDAPLHFPVPWAPGPASSFLVTAEAMRTHLEQAGFRVIDWTDSTAEGIAWFAARAAQAREAGTPPPALGLPLVMGDGFGEMTGNLARNLRESRAALIQAVLEKP